MSTADVAALIALCAALASAIGDVIRQRSAQEITDKEVGHLALFWLSVRDPGLIRTGSCLRNSR
jgi:hypothetical protein